MSEIRVDTISEKTSANGVVIDGVTLKDNTLKADQGSYNAVLGGNSLTFSRDGDSNILANATSSASLNITSGNKIVSNALNYHAFLTGSSGGTERARLTSSGLGIGESSPDTRLHVTETMNVAYSADNFTIDANALLKLENPSTTGAAFSAIQFRTGSGADLFFGGVQGSSNAGDFVFARQGSPDLELMRIASDGQVMISGSTTAFDTTGTVNGLHAYYETDSGLATIGSYSSGGTTSLTFHTNASGNASSEKVRILSDGKVGIGTSSPASIIDVQQSANGGTALHQFQNISNTTNSNSRLKIATGGTSAGDPILQLTNNSSNWYLFGDQSDSFKFKIGTSVTDNKIVIDSSGNVGIGTASPNFPLDVVSDSSANGIQLRGRSADNIAQFSFESNDSGTTYSQLQSLSSELKVKTIANIPMSFHTNNTERMRIHSSGMTELKVPDSANTLQLTPSGTNANGTINFNSPGNGGAIFKVANSEKMRIHSNGRVSIGTTNGDNVFKVEGESSAGADAFILTNTRSSGIARGLQITYNSYAPDDANPALIFEDNAAVRFRVNNDGDVKNHDNSYGSTSDERIKSDIVDANSQWNDIKAIKVRNYKKKDDVRQYGDNAKIQIGVIAQELEAVSPKLVKEVTPSKSDILSDSVFGTLYTADDAETQDAVLYTSDDQEVIDGDKNVGDIKTPSTKKVGDIKETKDQVKSVSYSVLYMKAIKALQEAMTRIETLEAKVTTLENN